MRENRPLRRVIREETEIISQAGGVDVRVHVEVLECGHRVRPRQDCFGETHAVRRRCSKCAKEGKTRDSERPHGSRAR